MPKNYKNYEYHSILAPYINGCIDEKRSLGFDYSDTAYTLVEFDRYCIQTHLDTINVTRTHLEKWMTRKDTEGCHYQTCRISASRQVLLYMAGLGIEVYIPMDFTTKKVVLPHILSSEEIIAFFNELDNYAPIARFQRFGWQYKVFFRILYSTGMRNGELCSVKMSNVDLEKGIITLYHAKGDKDRLVYLSEDVRQLCIEYTNYLRRCLGFEPFWLFPAQNTDNHFDIHLTDMKFNELWKRTPYCNMVEKKPTVHSFRFTFVVNRMNAWMEQGVDLDVMLPYLSKYLGHKGVKETFYYYHMVKDAHKIIRQKDSMGKRVIPKMEEEQ